MNFFRQIALVEIENINAHLNFEDRYCLDIGAFLILEASNRYLGPIFDGGRINKSTMKVLDAVGLRAALGMGAPSISVGDDVRPFRIQRRSRPTGTQTESLIDVERSEKVSRTLCQWIDEVLTNVAEQVLNDVGMSLVEQITGEALDNAKTHGDIVGEDGEWTIAGFMAKREDRYRFHLAFLNVGATISESLDTAPDPIRSGMNQYVTRHANVRKDLSEENLKTVYALQDGVTRLERKLVRGPGEEKGGTGLADVIDFFADLAGTGDEVEIPKLAILSGSTYILIAPPYNKALREGAATFSANERAPRRIWFNAENTDLKPSDAKHVFSVSPRLNGTLITMAFNLDPAYLHASVENDDDND